MRAAASPIKPRRIRSIDRRATSSTWLGRPRACSVGRSRWDRPRLSCSPPFWKVNRTPRWATGRVWAFFDWASAIRPSVWKRPPCGPCPPEPEVDSGTVARPPTRGGSGDPTAARALEPARRFLLRSRRAGRRRRSHFISGELMLNQPTIEKLHALRLHGMAEAFRAQPQQAGITELSFEERFALLVDQQWNWRQNRALARRLAKAKLRHRACVEDIDFRSPRGLDRTLVRSLTQDSAWVREHQNIFLIGPTGIGKSFLACALAEKACRDGFTAFYTRAAQLFRDLVLARADGSLRSLLARLARVDVLLIDDWAMAPLADTERRDFLEICEDRDQMQSMILTSQLPVAKWHEQIGDPTLADSILDRLVHNAHRIEMRGESMRKKRGKEQ